VLTCSVWWQNTGLAERWGFSGATAPASSCAATPMSSKARMHAARPGSGWSLRALTDIYKVSVVVYNCPVQNEPNEVVTIVIKKILLLTFLLFAFSLPQSAVAADDSDNMAAMEKMSAQLKKISKKLRRGQFDGNDLTAWTKLSIKMRSAASLCISNSEAALLDLKTVMDGLGEKVKGEDVEVTKKRKAYQKQKADGHEHGDQHIC